ncbi:MAG: Gfo/Idh/MocA family oxidoreductase [Niameybacter sp.]|uniref:Gfo/Idh/MocA family protein n=1 Tax=Niameybacter sp. TaxID=2033640 RepID=UPI002FC67296
MGYKLAIVGLGGMGGWHYENITKRIDEIDVVGAYDIREEVRPHIEALGLKCYNSLEELVNDKEIDIVTIATPNDVHKDIAITCMRHGKHVVCEKPVTMNAQELEEVMAVQKETGKLFSVHQNRRWDKDYVIIKKVIEEQMIGKACMIENRVQGSRQAMHGWRAYKINGGGMMLDWGVHLVDQLLDMIPAPVVDVYADLHALYSEEVDDNLKVMLKFENEVSAIVEVATNCFINQARWHVIGEEGTAVINDWSCNGQIVKLNTEEAMEWADAIVYTEAGPTRTMAPRPSETTINLPLPEAASDWTDYYKNIVSVLDGTAELIVKPEQCLRVMKVIDAIFKSQEKKTSISCCI